MVMQILQIISELLLKINIILLFGKVNDAFNNNIYTVHEILRNELV